MSGRPITRAAFQLATRRYRSDTARKRQHSLPANYYRGGTSRAIIFNRADLPEHRDEWKSIFLSAIGSPDPNGRQLDGLGGGISSLSKICIVGVPSTVEGADVDYTFAAIGVKTDDVDYSSNCGNMTSAIGPFVIDTKLIHLGSERTDTTVRIYNTNTGKIVHATFPIANGEACAYGDLAIDGIADTAAPVLLEFIRPAGSKTGTMLPTGNAVDIIGEVAATCIDVGNPAVFVRAKDFGVMGTMTSDNIDAHPTLLSDLDVVRKRAAVKMGLAKRPEEVPGSIPKICMVARAAAHTLPSGRSIAENEIDVVLRALSVGQPHKAVPVTLALAAAAAAKVDGSIVHEHVSKSHADPSGITLGHASGKLLVNANFDRDKKLESVTLFRTARRLFEGRVFFR